MRLETKLLIRETYMRELQFLKDLKEVHHDPETTAIIDSEIRKYLKYLKELGEGDDEKVVARIQIRERER